MDKWIELKERVEALEKKRERALGAKQAILDRLKGLGYNSKEEAAKAVEKQQEQLEAMKKELEERMEELERQVTNIESTVQ